MFVILFFSFYRTDTLPEVLGNIPLRLYAVSACVSARASVCMRTCIHACMCFSLQRGWGQRTGDKRMYPHNVAQFCLVNAAVSYPYWGLVSRQIVTIPLTASCLQLTESPSERCPLCNFPHGERETSNSAAPDRMSGDSGKLCQSPNSMSIREAGPCLQSRHSMHKNLNSRPCCFFLLYILCTFLYNIQI